MHYFHELFTFTGIEFTRPISDMIAKHTNSTEDAADPFAVSRDSKSAPFRWKQELTFDQILLVQERCALAMEKWEYFDCESEAELAQCETFETWLDEELV